MDEWDGNDALNMSILKELCFRQELTFVDTGIFGGAPWNLFPAEINRKDLNDCWRKWLWHKLLQFLSKIAIKNVSKWGFFLEPQ